MTPIRKWAASQHTGEGPVADATREARVYGAILTMCMHPVINAPTVSVVQDAVDAAADLRASLERLRDVLSV